MNEYGTELQKETVIMFNKVCDGFEILGSEWCIMINYIINIIIIIDSCEKIVDIIFEDINPLMDGLMTRERWSV